MSACTHEHRWYLALWICRRLRCVRAVVGRIRLWWWGAKREQRNKRCDLRREVGWAHGESIAANYRTLWLAVVVIFWCNFRTTCRVSFPIWHSTIHSLVKVLSACHEISHPVTIYIFECVAVCHGQAAVQHPSAADAWVRLETTVGGRHAYVPQHAHSYPHPWQCLFLYLYERWIVHWLWHVRRYVALHTDLQASKKMQKVFKHFFLQPCACVTKVAQVCGDLIEGVYRHL